MKENYGIIEGKRDDLPWVGIVNLKFKEYSSKDSLPWLLMVSCMVENTNEKGLPLVSESEGLNKFEDHLVRELSTSIKVYFIGRISWNNIREIFMQVSDAKKSQEIIEKIINSEQYPNEFEYKIAEDKNWSTVSSVFNVVNL